MGQSLVSHNGLGPCRAQALLGQARVGACGPSLHGPKLTDQQTLQGSSTNSQADLPKMLRIAPSHTCVA